MPNDFGFLANTSKYDKQVFYATSTTNWQTWIKPAGCSRVSIFTVGGAGSGGGGASGSTGGGGGGAPGQPVFYTTLAVLLPDVLYIQSGLGGLAVAAATVGNAGGTTIVSISPTSNGQDYVTNATGGGGGGRGVTTVAGAAGAAASGSGTTLWWMVVALGLPTADPGLIGGANVAGTSFAILSGNTGLGKGCGGGGGAHAGGSCTSGTSGVISTATLVTGGATSASAAAAGKGGDGYVLGGLMPASGGHGPDLPGLYPFLSLPGAGGGGNSSTGVGGAGGAGGYGSGGGGGGASSSGTAGGGGAGGDGFVIIICS